MEGFLVKFSATILLLSVALTTYTAEREPIEELHAGNLVEKLFPDDSQEYQFSMSLEKNQTPRLEIRQYTVCVKVTVTSPHGDVLLETAGGVYDESHGNGYNNLLFIDFPVEETGVYKIHMRPVFIEPEKMGRLEIKALKVNELPPGIDAIRNDPRVVYSRNHGAPIRSIDIGDDDFSDLVPLGEAIGNARIVMLGETNHCEGNSFMAKARLVRYLHEQKGFDVLVLESDAYGLHQLWRETRLGRSYYRDWYGIVHPIWSYTQEFKGLMDYVERRALTACPLALAGVDTQIHTESVVPDLFDFLARRQLGQDIVDARFYELLLNLARKDYPKKKTPPPGEIADRFIKEQLDPLIRQTHDFALEENELEAKQWAYWLESMRVQAIRYMEVPGFNPPQMRTTQMGRHLIHLARDVYPNKKLIIWAATNHIATNRVEIINELSGKPQYQYTQSMGQVARDVLVDEIYSIGMVQAGGYTNCWRSLDKSSDRYLLRSIKQDQSNHLEFEEIIGALPHDYFFMDLKHPKKVAIGFISRFSRVQSTQKHAWRPGTKLSTDCSSSEKEFPLQCGARLGKAKNASSRRNCRGA